MSVMPEVLHVIFTLCSHAGKLKHGKREAFMAAPLLFREESKHNGGLRRAAVLHALIHITTRLKGVHWN